jgi:shikimate dehydrogenase
MLKAGLLGYPIDHSLSPVIHNAAYAALGLDWHYGLYPAKDAEAFAAIIAEAKRNPQSYVGFNVTTPYKYEAYAACSTHSASDAAVGNTNVLTFLEAARAENPHYSQLRGANTDGRGLLAALKRELGIEAKGASVVLCGTGPVALSTLFALIEGAAASVTIATRDPKKGRVLVEALLSRLDRCDSRNRDDRAPLPEIAVIGYDEAAAKLETAALLINATTVGMDPQDGSIVPPAALRAGLSVYDVIYGHGETALIRAAREVGAQACDGVGMLVEQAALTIEIWAGEHGSELVAPRDRMYEVAYEELARVAVHTPPVIARLDRAI